MSSRALASRDAQRRASWWLGGGLAFGVVVGGVVSLSASAGFLLVVALSLAILVAFRPRAILVVLGSSVFIENTTVGGTTISRFIAALALLVVAAEGARGRATLRLSSPLAWAALYAIWAIASGLWTVSFSLTSQGLGSLAVSGAYMFAFATLLRSRRDLERVLYGVAVAACATGITAIIAFASGGTGRTEGLVGDPNFFAAYQIVAFPLVLVLAASVRREWVRLALFAAVIAIIGSIFTSLSRGGITSMILLTLLVLLLPARTLFRSLGQKMAALFVAGAGVAVALVISFGSLQERILTLTHHQEAVGSGRLNQWEAAWRSVNDRPVRGVGFGAFAAVSNELVRRTPGADLVHFDLRSTGVAVHNAYLGSAAELGLPGVTLFFGLLLATALALRRTVVQAQRLGATWVARAGNGFLFSLIGWSFASIFLSSETARPFWIIIGVAIGLHRLLPAAAPAPAGAATAEAR
jgi:O-antigen ligase